MSVEAFATWLVLAAGAYAAIGLVFALAFVARGIERIDPAARGASFGFRLVVLPGAVALWPLLARRWWSGATALPEESNAHRRAARAASSR
jgi:hypothetical protein